MPAPIRLGTQGWNYDAWAGPFYPEGTKAVDFLTVYSRAFDAVECNRSSHSGAIQLFGVPDVPGT